MTGSAARCHSYNNLVPASMPHHIIIAFFSTACTRSKKTRKNPLFVATPSPTDEDVKQVAETVAARAIRLLERRGVIGEQEV